MCQLNAGYVSCTGYVHNTEFNRIEAPCTAVLHNYLIYATNTEQSVRVLPGASQVDGYPSIIYGSYAAFQAKYNNIIIILVVQINTLYNYMFEVYTKFFLSYFQFLMASGSSKFHQSFCTLSQTAHSICNLFASHDIHMIMTWAQEAKFIILKLKMKMNAKRIQIFAICQPVGPYFQYVHMSNVLLNVIMP